MKNTLIAGLLGGVTLFLWGIISYMALPWHMTYMHAIPNGDEVMQVLQHVNQRRKLC